MRFKKCFTAVVAVAISMGLFGCSEGKSEMHNQPVAYSNHNNIFTEDFFEGIDAIYRYYGDRTCSTAITGDQLRELCVRLSELEIHSAMKSDMQSNADGLISAGMVPFVFVYQNGEILRITCMGQKGFAITDSNANIGQLKDKVFVISSEYGGSLSSIIAEYYSIPQ